MLQRCITEELKKLIWETPLEEMVEILPEGIHIPKYLEKLRPFLVIANSELLQYRTPERIYYYGLEEQIGKDFEKFLFEPVGYGFEPARQESIYTFYFKQQGSL